MAKGLLSHKSVREIAAELEKSKALQKRLGNCSLSTLVRDARSVRAMWVREHLSVVEELFAEDLARFAAIEALLIPKCLEGDGEAIDRWLRVQAARAQRLGIRPTARVIGTGDGMSVEEAPHGAAIEVRVRYVDDWRAVRQGELGAGVLEVGHEPPRLVDLGEANEEETDGEGATREG